MSSRECEGTNNYKGFKGRARNEPFKLVDQDSRAGWMCLKRDSHYNAGMGSGIATWCLVKSFRVTLMLWGICLFSPPPAAAQRFLADDSSPSNSHATEAPKAIVATPVPAQPHDFWDRTNFVLFSGIVVTRGMDYASTRNFQARGRQEILLPDAVVDNSAGFASLEAAATVTSVGISYLLHRTGHHTLERWISIGHVSVTGFGDVRNYALESRHRP